MIAVVIISCAYAITVLCLVAASENVVVATLGKIKTVCQMIALILLMLKLEVIMLCEINVRLWMLCTAVVLMVCSGVDYVRKPNKQVMWN